MRKNMPAEGRKESDMKATLLNYRRGRHTQTMNQLLAEVEGCETKAMASRFIGRKVVWKSPSGKEIFGKVTQPHGTRGVLRVRFSRGLPGDALGSRIEISE
jgi:large subunit ribosomal protein L35Ae